MNYEIVEISALSGRKATIYSVIPEGDKITLLEQFLINNEASYPEETRAIVNKIRTIGHTTGAREIFFKQYEGKPGDGVCALYDDKESKLRQYCIRYGNVAIILGSGGPKPHGTRTWQENDQLRKEAKRMISISEDIKRRMEIRELRFSPDGTKLLGNLKISDNEE